MKKMKGLLSLCVAAVMLMSAFSGAALTASAADEINSGLNVVGGNLEFVNDSSYPWVYGVTDIGYYGAKAGNSGVADSVSTISLTHTFGAEEGISFNWRVSSQEKWDTFTFAVDGEPVETISGNLAWENKVIPIAEGEHTLTWTYSKDDRYDLYQDRAALDEVYVTRVSAASGHLDDILSPGGLLTFETDPVNQWVPHSLSAGYVAKSTVEGKSGAETAITLRQTLEKGKVLKFFWKTDCENIWDRFIFEVNGEEQASITGVTSYSSYEYVIEEAGDYVFRWVYKKDTLTDRGADSAYLGNVSISDYVPVSGVVIMKSTSASVGGSTAVVHSIKPSSATNKAVIWEVADENIATIDEKGVLTGVSVGTTTVTVKTVDGEKTASCTISVTAAKSDVTYYVDPAKGRDTNKGLSSTSALKTLEAAVVKAHTVSGFVRIVLMGDVEVSSELRLNYAKVNLVAASGMTCTIKRASGYKGVILNAALGSELYIGNTDGSGGLSIGHSSADAPALLVDMGRVWLYGGSHVTGNSSTVSGAGVYLNEGSFVMLGGSINGNSTARYGGAIYADGGSLRVSGSAVIGANTAGVYGGGAYVATEAEASFAADSVVGNTAAEGYDDVCFEKDLPTSDKEYTSADGRFVYRIDYENNGIEIIGWNPLDEDVIDPEAERLSYAAVIPAEIDGYTVISIGKNAFREYDDTERPLGSVTLPETVERLEYGAFRGCKLLTGLSLDSLEQIGEYAFYQCDGLAEVTLPEGLASIGYGAFSYCPSLVKATVSGRETVLEEYAFYMTAEGFTLRGYYPSTAYSYAIANGILFEDIVPYEAPTVVGAEDGEVYNVYYLTEGVAISWESEYPTEALLNSEPYVAGAPITEVGEYIFTLTDGRSSVTLSFTLVYDAPNLPGDMDGDGEITVSDALLILRAAAGISEITPEVSAIADVDGDGEITVADALNALRTAIFS